MVNIDTVYQKVLALANKEQRGYITPQEFNLLADKAQLDILNNYFHNLKTANHKRKNQTEASESFDDAEMIEEKLGWLRKTQYLDSIFETGGNIDKVVAWIPTDCYKIASVYLDGVGDKLYEDPYTIDQSKKVENVEITKVSKSELLYMNQNPLTKPTIKRPVYVLYDSGHIWSGGGTYMELHPQVKMAFHVYENAGVQTTMWQVANTNTESNFYSQFATIDGAVITGGLDQSANEGINGVPTNTGFTTHSSTILIDFYRKPMQPNWSYVVVGGKALYNSNNSTHFDLHPSEEETLVTRILELAGILIQKPDLHQAAMVDKASTKQEQND